MDKVFLLAGVVLAGTIIAWAAQVRSLQLRIGAAVLAVLVLCAFFTLASFRFVGEDAIGVVTKNIGLKSLPPGKIIATLGEKGPQARILPPGWHPWYWPFIYDIDKGQVTKIPAGSVGLLNAKDGLPLPRDTAYAPEWPEGTEREMAQDAEFFLGEVGLGTKGPQTSVLKPGSYRINPSLFELKTVPVTTIEKATVGVVKSNVGDRPVVPEGGTSDAGKRRTVKVGERGIWREPLLEGQYYLNTDAFQITLISTRKHIVRYTAAQSKSSGGTEESEIMVRTSDGFTFPVDVRIEFEIQPGDAPILVATLGDDQDGLRTVMNSVVRAIFRNNAESVKALDYVQQRSHQESQSLMMLKSEMQSLGVTVTGVRIGDVGNEETLGTLLKTQKDREIALQEQETFREQQRAAEQKKQLTKTEQEAEEEKRLATADYGVKIAERDKEKLVIAAQAEAEAVAIKAEAQATAYKLIAEQIGSGNAALVELLKIVGERNISITPRVMVVGQGGGSHSGETTALIGTMLDTMMQDPPRK
ncbi:MAG: hypothetical protein IH831_04135 [Planctomycetes bacterium]|nr:hypothetical protein [Planctomycetota bacterium]